ncbi:DUF1592 domain-containing protein [Sphingobium tyrosinilyticum]|uniref:DUF1592 domain-containing protein n=1 Tax=Sphingobium tyrosinilyticum TaxID=2715436 RepID=A0ABV9F4W3_9SPHN
MRRLTEKQYRNAIADIFGEDIKVAGRFDPIVRPEHELIATGASIAVLSSAGFEQFDAMARGIAAQVLDEKHRAIFLTCKPAQAAKADPRCAGQFIKRIGLSLFRRPLSAKEVSFYVDVAGNAASTLGDFYKGLHLSLASMLVSPQFLFWIETATPDGKELDSWSKAARLSSILWNTVPDAALLKAARSGEINTPDGLRAQVERMMASPRFEEGARAFFSDFLQLDRVDDVAKDPLVYPRFTTGVGSDFKEQTLRTMVDHLLTRDQPYPQIFTTRHTYLNRRLGLVYGIPVASTASWEPIDLPTDSDRVGLLGQGAFLALFSHEGRSSPTLRGRAIREVLMCQPVPNPPANVDFSGFNDTSNDVLKTARQRLDRHNSDPVCAACHKITDPLGLPLEQYDGIGGRRLTENGASINTAGAFEGKSFNGLSGLSALMAQSQAPSECIARRAVEYASGLGADKLPEGWVEAILKAFQADNFRFRSLIRSIALSPQFFSVSTQALTPASAHVAMADNSNGKVP